MCALCTTPGILLREATFHKGWTIIMGVCGKLRKPPLAGPTTSDASSMDDSPHGIDRQADHSGDGGHGHIPADRLEDPCVDGRVNHCSTCLS